DFPPEYLEHIRFYCLVMSEGYIRKHFGEIKGFASVIEDRLDDEDCTMESVLEDNASFLKRATAEGVEYFLIDESYKLPL
ncbi:MAG: adenylate kinase, partial [Clostridia bacterium]|nr:adenylate kinase [Clostridia bacterium]